MQKSFFNAGCGFTLIEVMIALALFSVGIMAVASMQGVSMKGVARAKNGMFDSLAASGQIERILSLPYDDPQLTDIDHGYFPDTPDHGPFNIPITRSTIAWEVQDDFPAPGTKRITIIVHKAGSAGNGPVMIYQYVKSKDFSS